MSCCPSPISAVRGRRLTALGFTVAPDGLHPFGTANCCVYLRGRHVPGAAGRQRPRKSERLGASGKRLHRARRRLPDECRGGGVFRPRVRHAGCRRGSCRFVRAGFSAGNILEFSRPFADASGKSAVATFRLAFAADPEAPDIFVFTCQRLNVPQDRPQRAAASCKWRGGHRQGRHRGGRTDRSRRFPAGRQRRPGDRTD